MNSVILSKGVSRTECAQIGFSFSFFKDPPLKTKARLFSLSPAPLSQQRTISLQLQWNQITNPEYHWKPQVFSWGRARAVWTSSSKGPVTTASTQKAVSDPGVFIHL